MKDRSVRNSLFEQVLGQGADLRVRVTGRSMGLFIADQDVVTLRSVAGGSIRCGDLVFYKGRDGEAILHRVVWTGRGKSGKRVFRTKGDALALWDPLASMDRILGRVVRIEKSHSPGRGRVWDLEKPFWRLANRCLGVVHQLRARKRNRSKTVLAPNRPAREARQR